MYNHQAVIEACQALHRFRERLGSLGVCLARDQRGMPDAYLAGVSPFPIF
jgi:hypothetical protein